MHPSHSICDGMAVAEKWDAVATTWMLDAVAESGCCGCNCMDYLIEMPCIGD